MAKAVTTVQTGKKLDTPVKPDEATHEAVTIQPGTDVSASDFETQEEYDSLVAAGAIVEDDSKADDVLSGEVSTVSQNSSEIMEQFSTAVPGAPENPETGIPEEGNAPTATAAKTKSSTSK